MPCEAVFVEGGPEEAEAEGAGGEEDGEVAAAHGAPGGVLVVEGAEGDAGAAHSRGGLGEGEEERLVEEIEEGEDEEAGGQCQAGLESGVGCELDGQASQGWVAIEREGRVGDGRGWLP